MGDDMDLEQLVEDMSSEERECFLKTSTSDYFRYIESQEEYQKIVEKVNQSEKLTEAEWSYISSKLYVVSCRTLIEEDSFSFLDRLYILIGKIGLLISKKDRPIYNECYKMIAYANSFKQEKEINEDCLNGLDVILEKKQETDLDILLRQYQESIIFGNNQMAFMEAYKKSSPGVITMEERMYMNAFQKAYQREKELVKQMGQN